MVEPVEVVFVGYFGFWTEGMTVFPKTKIKALTANQRNGYLDKSNDGRL